jgi:hypothetical protein
VRLPGWIVDDIKGSGHLYVRLWHPGFWWRVWQEIDIEPHWLKPALFVYIMLRVLKGD